MNYGAERAEKPPTPATLPIPPRASVPAVAHVFAPVPPVFTPVAAVFLAVADVLARVTAILDAIATPAVVPRVAPVLAPIATILGSVAPVFAAIPPVFATVAYVFSPVRPRAVPIGACLRHQRRRGDERQYQGLQNQSSSHRPHSSSQGGLTTAQYGRRYELGRCARASRCRRYTGNSRED